MITISPKYNEHKVAFSNPGSGWRGYSVMAKSLEEVHLAIDHYHNQRGKRHPKSKCPLCRLMAEEEAKRQKKGKR